MLTYYAGITMFSAAAHTLALTLALIYSAGVAAAPYAGSLSSSKMSYGNTTGYSRLTATLAAILGIILGQR